MTNRELERRLRRLAQRETAQTTPAFDRAFARAMEEGKKTAAKTNPKRKNPLSRRWTLAAVCAAALVLVAVAAMRPLKDTRRGYVPTTELQGDLSPLAAEQKPVSSPAPFVQAQAKMDADALTVTVTWHNPTGDIWLVTWEPMPHPKDARWTQIRNPYPLVWLEPGTTCMDAAIWKLPEGESKPSSMAYSYEGYRVSADMLFWVEDLLSPTDEGYGEQQELLEDAFANQALMLAPGMWESGEAGEMTLVLPVSYQRGHPEQTPLAYYVENGMLDAGSAGSCIGMQYAVIP